MAQIILQKYANREIRIGYQSIAIAPKNKGDKVEDVRKERFAQKLVDLYVSNENLKGGYELGHDRSGRAIAIPYTQEKHRYLQTRLDIKSEFQQRSLEGKNRGGWGFAPKPTIFGRNARHRILEAGAVMDSMSGKNCCEVTCTLPGSTKRSLSTLSQWSGWIMNRITQVVRRSTDVTGWFYVWELQKRGALHLHFVIAASTLSDAVHLAQEIEFKWFELLLELKEKANVDVFERWYGGTWRYYPQKWQSHVLPVYKSVAAYFAKYCGKQSNNVKSASKKFIPARWWGSSSSIKRGIEDARIKINVEVSLPMAESALLFLRNVFAQYSPIKTYKYNFDLGTSSSGTILGGGWREISYFHSERFLQISEIIPALGEYLTQTWGIYADIPCLHKESNADIKYRGVI